MGNPKLGALSWWRKWQKRDWVIAAIGFTIIILFSLTLLFHARNANHSSTFGGCSAINDSVPLTLLQRAKDTGAYFYNWNKVKIRYCDGASYAGHPESEFKNGTELYFRGQLIWEAIMDEFLSLGMSNAKQALLTGCSSGGLASLIHCDDFRDHLPKDATVKCAPDAGFFLDELDILGHATMRAYFADLVQLQCIFPQEIVKNVKTPVFIINSAYDAWQIPNVLVPEESDPQGDWRSCKSNIKECNSSQIETLQGFRNSMLEALSEFGKNEEGGMFINSCSAHCQTLSSDTWHSPNSPRINNKSIAEAVGDCKSKLHFNGEPKAWSIVLVEKMAEEGLVCLDGSLPGYHFQKGFGSGSNNWLLHLEGGAWCNSVESCNYRKGTALGSSKYMQQAYFDGILSRNSSQNPDFYNWNKVKIRYCDGASFAGHPESEFKNGTKLYFRGQLIWEAIMNEFLSLGMSNAKQALLTGCSAGGLATLIHCDEFRDHLPKDATVKCVPDAGFFLDELDILGHATMRAFYADVVKLQGVARSLNKNCVERIEPSECIFPQEIVKNVKTPVFIINSAYDSWQIQNVLVPNGSDPQGYWKSCRLNIKECNSSQIETLQGFRNSLLKALSEFGKNEEGGMFINSCYVHCQTLSSATWHSPNSPRINDKSIAESVGDWYFNRKVSKLIDCPYPCNPTCYANGMDLTSIL
ncbi:Pectinacetylesterase [Corchorus olitorius]|uniref:Pectinacetylesterase n=1 Tax=Corchorus olitorius TaxID=93759 RepID=A0A1R3JR14_9ROSI|nr:Pectinacetylesterase [Corchorus olitorius]